MKKKLFALFLATFALTTVLGGCAQKTTDSASTSTPDTTQSDVSTPAAEENTEPGAPAGYPNGTISFIVSSSAGSATDTAARAFVDNLDLGGDIVIENISGGSQTIGTTEALSRAADGQTLVMMANAGLYSQPLMSQLAYTVDDLRILSDIYPHCIAIVFVRPDSPLQTADDFMDYIKNNQFSYGCANIGGYAHIAMSSALIQLGLLGNATPVAYDGSQNVMQAVLNGELDFAILDDNFINKYIESGDLRGLLTLYDGPTPLLPDITPISDYGVTGMGSMVGIKFLAVHKDTPEDIAQYIKQQADAAVMSDTYQQFLQDSGVGTMDEIYTEEELQKTVASAVEQTREVLVQLGLAQ
jgi:tripartite-type tricarboxylate transporter receptor subunit TctC